MDICRSWRKFYLEKKQSPTVKNQTLLRCRLHLLLLLVSPGDNYCCVIRKRFLSSERIEQITFWFVPFFPVHIREWITNQETKIKWITNKQICRPVIVANKSTNGERVCVFNIHTHKFQKKKNVSAWLANKLHLYLTTLSWGLFSTERFGGTNLFSELNLWIWLFQTNSF